MQAGNDDEYMRSFLAPSPGSYRYTYRVSVDAGESWTYCDLDGAGSDPSMSFDLADLGTMTVTP